MQCSAFRRVKQELKDLKETENDTCKIEVLNDDWSKLRAEIAGPIDSPYEGGIFELSILIPPRYPFIGPTITFTKNVWHPNISFTSGYICLDILYDAWSPSMTLRTSLLSIQALMSVPNPISPEETLAAVLLIKSPTLYRLAAQHWTHIFANGPRPNVDFGQAIKDQLRSGLINRPLAENLCTYYNTYTNEDQTITPITLEDDMLGPNTSDCNDEEMRQMLMFDTSVNRSHNQRGNTTRHRRRPRIVNRGNPTTTNMAPIRHRRRRQTRLNRRTAAADSVVSPHIIHMVDMMMRNEESHIRRFISRHL